MCGSLRVSLLRSRAYVRRVSLLTPLTVGELCESKVETSTTSRYQSSVSGTWKEYFQCQSEVCNVSLLGILPRIARA
jgi:hypothetical protein